MEEIKKEDYQEQACLLCKEEYRIPIGRILEKLDSHLSKNDYAAGEALLRYWLEDAIRGRDLRGALTLQEECMGLFRKLGKKEEALQAAEKALELLSELDLEGTLAASTVRLNAGTVFSAFGDPDRAIGLFETARKGYESLLPPDDSRLAGLYNNMALTLTALGRYGEARENYLSAISIMQKDPEGKGEEAISLLNLCNLVEAEKGLEAGDREIEEYLDRAESLLAACPDTPHCAFVFEKCAPSFSYYGYFAAAEELTKRAKEIYQKE